MSQSQPGAPGSPKLFIAQQTAPVPVFKRNRSSQVGLGRFNLRQSWVKPNRISSFLERYYLAAGFRRLVFTVWLRGQVKRTDGFSLPAWLLLRCARQKAHQQLCDIGLPCLGNVTKE